MHCRTLTYFAVVLDFHMAARGYDCRTLALEIDPRSAGAALSKSRTYKNIRLWRKGITYPTQRTSYQLLGKIEEHFGLREGYFASLDTYVSPTNEAVRRENACDQVAVRWHLPKNFDDRPEPERDQILDWIRSNVLSGNTEYGKYQSRHSGTKFAVVFPTLPREYGGRRWMGTTKQGQIMMGNNGGYGTIPASPNLAAEMANLVAFKTAAIAPRGYRRFLRWCPQSAFVAVHRFGHIFGALAAAPMSSAAGLGVPMGKLTFALLAFPAVWDWYLHWCERRRGFFSVSERSMLYEAKSLTRDPSGWLRQHPKLAQRLSPIPGLISSKEVRAAQKNWSAACDQTFQHSIFRMIELRPITRMHRDPFAGVLPVLCSKNPLREYIKIAPEIVRWMPDKSREPCDWACAVRNYLMFRFAIHLGLRQRNLRELLLCSPGDKYRSIRALEQVRRGELRWNAENRSWDVFIPAVAFKNGNGSFFRGRPYQLVLANLCGLYKWIRIYIEECRPILLRGSAMDPGTFFVRHAVRKGHYNPQFEIYSFYDAWTQMIRRYGIYNPYTGRGAIKGLLPHGPHCVRDILATHILKRTGSYELASFAIQDNMEAVMRHYSRFLPHEKIERAAQELNKAWR